MFDGLLEMIKSSIQGSLAGFLSMITSAEDALLGQNFGFSTTSIWQSCLALSNLLKPFCTIVIVLCLLIEVAQVAQRVDMIKVETGIKLGTKMALSYVCLDNAPLFLKACYDQANIWISLLFNNVSTTEFSQLIGQLDNRLLTEISSVNGFDSILGLWASSLLLTLAIRVCGLIIIAIAFGRMFEIYIYLVISPLPCAFFPLGDGSGGGFSRITMKFFKTFIAVCLQGVMMVVCINLFELIIVDAILALIGQVSAQGAIAVTDLCFTLLLGAVVLVMSVVRCGGWAKNIIDAM